ncbi:HAD family hydrolase [Promicromonospora sp. CA-289599]|uniref:HAD family hydrolase n=1 Tax=Promicromonospora sp. CA-289599 TaxID=3240014 RepID=UPI003D8E2D4A
MDVASDAARLIPPNQSQPLIRRLIALDVDGTLLGQGLKIPTGTVDALDMVRAAGHEVVLATGRSLVGLMPVATRLGLVEGYAVSSNGSLTVRLDPAVPAGYVIEDARRFDPGPVVHRALALEPRAHVGVEDVGWGWAVNQVFPDGLLNGEQKQTLVTDLCAAPATRVAVHAPGIDRHLDALRATGVTVTPAGPGWADVTGAGTSKATALERLRTGLGIPPEATVAVGDGANDVDMFRWAARAVAMGHAEQNVRDAADEITGTIAQHGVIAVLDSLLPANVDTTALSRLAAQLATAVHTAPGSGVALRVWHGTRTGLMRCETWTFRNGTWLRHAPVPAGTGATMRGVENAAREAGLIYPRGDEGRRRAQWRASFTEAGPAGFELPLTSA